MQRRYINVVAATLTLFGLISATVAPVSAEAPEPQKRIIPPKFTRNLNLMLRERWNGDDGPYQRINAQIDLEIAKSRKPEQVWLRYAAAGRKSPHDPFALYRWAYSLFHYSLTIHDTFYLDDHVHDLHTHVNDLAEFMEMAPSVDTYSFARMRYYFVGPAIELTPIGERLIQRDSHDVEIKRRLVWEYFFAYQEPRADEYFQRGLILGKQLVAMAPKNADCWDSLGRGYELHWFGHHYEGSELPRLAIAAYRHAVAIGPPEYGRVQMSKGSIRYIQEEAAKHNIKL